MIREPKILLYELIMSLSQAVDLVSTSVADHHMKVAYIAFSLGVEMGLNAAEQDELILAGALHDIGALSLSERLEFLDFEVKNPHKHAELGYLLLNSFEPLRSVAEIIRYHHVPWSHGKGTVFNGNKVPFYSHIIHLADRVAVLINPKEEPITQAQGIIEKITAKKEKLFKTELVEIFTKLAVREYFWLEAASPSRSSMMFRGVLRASIVLDTDGLLSFAELFSKIIDFRSRHTATHSTGVAAVAEKIASIMGFSERETRDIKIAGYLHDLGKLSIPKEILDKEETLTDGEFNIIKRHAFFTFNLIDQIESMDHINTWASYHHERLDGSGYPFHLTEKTLPLGSRIIAVADIFTALTEDRPYRKGMADREVLAVIDELSDNGEIDSYIVSILKNNLAEISRLRLQAQQDAREEYQRIL